MLSPQPIERDIVLIGGGHAHVAVIKRFGMRPAPGVRLTLIAKESQTPYSGMVPGFLRDVYDWEECHIDLGRLARWAGASIVRAPATGLDTVGQHVLFDDRPPLAYDIASVDVGSTPPQTPIPGAAEHALPIKPLPAFFQRMEALDRTAVDGMRLAVVGAGAGGVETALGLKRRYAGRNVAIDMTLISSDADILPGHSPAVRRRMRRALSDAGVTLRLRDAAVEIDADGVLLKSGARIAADLTMLVNGAAAPAWFQDTGLALDDQGFIKTNGFLQSPNCPDVFAAGDCQSFQPKALPKSGVYAVRQGPALAENLRRAALEQPLKAWRPQPVTLSLMATGDGGAVVSYGRFAASGRWAWTWKDRIDRRWMRKYRDLPPMKPPKLKPVLDGDGLPLMRCGGCGAKVASPILRRALATVGLTDAAGDDAAVLTPKPGMALVQTVDQFRNFLDDPYLFGEIATVHALSDLYAMGAAPDSALLTVVLPHMGERAAERDLVQTIAGVARALDAAGARLVGGHTGEGAEMSVGLSLNGYMSPGAGLAKGGAEAGDALILTKALGVGAILAADMRGKAATADVEGAICQMRRSSAAAAEILKDAGAHAATDVTGFGLAGHLIEMADGAGLTAELALAETPMLTGGLAAVRAGIESSMAPANAAFAARMDWTTTNPDDAAARLLFDPQTSGGLLVAVPMARRDVTLQRLRESGDASAAAIGHFVAPDPARIAIRVV